MRIVILLVAALGVACSGEVPMETPHDGGVTSNDARVVDDNDGGGAAPDRREIEPDAPRLVINEIMYHAPDHLVGSEFVELYNAADEPLQVGGWYLDGFNVTLPDITVAPGAYLTLAEDRDGFFAAYGAEPDVIASGRFRNSGELLELNDADRRVIDSVEYDDESPWPIAPDGAGTSLELVSPLVDNADVRYWRSGGPSPGFENTAFEETPRPHVAALVFPKDPDPDAAMDVTATIDDATAANLIVKIDFSPEQSIAMMAKGTTFSAQVAGQAAGRLVRLRVEATGPGGAGSWPRDDDSVAWDGTVVRDPSVSTSLPLFQWFVEPAVYDEAVANAFDRDHRFDAVFYFEGRLFDATTARIKGDSSRTFAKTHWKFKLPRGHRFFLEGHTPAPIDQLNLHSSYADKSYIRETLSHRVFQRAGLSNCFNFPVRLHRNGAYFGLYRVVEDMDRDYLRRHGFDPDGAWYEAKDVGRPAVLGDVEWRYDKKTRQEEGYEDLVDFLAAVDAPTSADYFLDHLDIANAINYLAANVLIHNNDHISKNYYLHRDSEGTGRWSIAPWDMDLTFGRNYGPGEVLNDTIWADDDRPDPGRPQVSPSHPQFGNRDHQKWDELYNRIYDAILAHLPFRTMFYRRLRTLMDDILAPSVLEGWIQEEADRVRAEVARDAMSWGQYGAPMNHQQALDQVRDYLARRRTHLFTTHQVTNEIPAASSNPTVVINELHYRPTGGSGDEFIELFNPMTVAVDLSGWRVEGVDLTIPSGTVILPGAYAVLVKSDAQFRRTNGGGRFLPAAYPEVLDDIGETIALVDPSGRVVDRLTFAAAAPWPVLAGSGASIELIDPALDRADPANWARSRAAGGTPDAVNSVRP